MKDIPLPPDQDEKDLATAEDLVSAIFGYAILERASDIHIEPYQGKVRIRFRIDGTLQEKWVVPTYKMESIGNRLKVLAGLDISARPVPQDGRFEIDVKMPHGKEPKPGEELPQKVSARISVFLTVDGEALVMRLLNRSEMFITLEQNDMDEETLVRCRALFAKTYGMVLVTGPSGSGKTTLLYSILRELHHTEKNIITLEDPVEYRFDGMRQVQMIPDQGLTFASGMKSILRQDPDVIMIGEIRDPETAEYAVRASLVGRLVFSTIHANTGVGIIARLLDMNIERSLIAYALNGVVSKRLVRKVCDGCVEQYYPNEATLKYFGIDPAKGQFRRGKGCEKCHQTGFYGRVALIEVLEFDNQLRSLIMERASITVLQEYMEQSGMRTLKLDAARKVLAGLTTIEEAAKAV